MGTHEAARSNIVQLDELEDAHEHAEILLTRYAEMLSEQLSALLSVWHTDLEMIIEDRYGDVPDDELAIGAQKSTPTSAGAMSDEVDSRSGG